MSDRKSGFRISVLTAAIAVAAVPFLSGVSGAQQAAQPGISPELEQVCSSAAPGELIPVIIVLEEQAGLDALLPLAQSLSRRERRAFAVTALSALSQSTQRRVLQSLEAARTEGRSRSIVPLWVGNGVLALAAPEVIRSLAALPEVRTVLWDPPLQPGQAEDAGQDDPAHFSSIPPGGTPESIWWQVTYVRATEAWDLGYRGEGIVVAVLDSGFDRFHPDLASHVWNNLDEIAGNGTDDDGNGYIDDTWGWNFQGNNNNPYPLSGQESHGTNCAGIVAGDGSAGTNTGVAPGASLMSCKVNTWGQNILAIEYAIANGADVISMSRSEKWRFTPKPDYDWWRSITDNELLAGICHANSIGNEGDNLSTDPIPFNISAPGGNPAPWRHPEQIQAGVSGIIGCGAIAQNDVIADYSSRGPATWEDIHSHWPEYPHAVRTDFRDYPWWGGSSGLIKPDLVAPGPGTRSTTFPGGGYGTFAGTSAATPHVAAAMAICLQANPDLSPEDVAMILQTTAFDLGSPGKDNVFGAGKLDCYAAVQAARQLASNGTIRGVVRSAVSESPIAQVLVEVVGVSYSVVTGTDGAFELVLPESSYQLRFSHPDYLTRVVPVSLPAGTIVTLDVLLERNLTGLEDTQIGRGAGLELRQNSPNPCGSRTAILYAVDTSRPVVLAIFDIQGRSVRRLVDGVVPAGTHSVQWDGRDDRGASAGSGIYLYQITDGRDSVTRAMVVLATSAPH